MKQSRLLLVYVPLACLCLVFVGLGFNVPFSAAEGPKSAWELASETNLPEQCTEYTQHFSASLCSQCGFGNKKDNCAKCGKWCGSTKIPARLCTDCGFGNRKDNCVNCGKWCGSTKIPASLCSDCGFGNRKNNCVKCGHWAP